MSVFQKPDPRNTTKMIATLGILTAACVVISLYLTIHTEILKITFTFIPIIIAARLYGPVGAGLVAGMADMIEMIVHPVGAWFPPITLTGIAVGVFLGFLFKNKWDFKRILIAAVVSELIVSFFITPIWLNILYHTPYTALLMARIPQIIIMTIVKIAILPPMFKIMDRVPLFDLKKKKEK